MSDGTEAGTVRVKDINTSVSSCPNVLENLGGILFFSADDGTNGFEPWISDGTESGTYMLIDMNPTGNGYYEWGS